MLGIIGLSCVNLLGVMNLRGVDVIGSCNVGFVSYLRNAIILSLKISDKDCKDSSLLGISVQISANVENINIAIQSIIHSNIFIIMCALIFNIRNYIGIIRKSNFRYTCLITV